jgi:hypothetical protein
MSGGISLAGTACCDFKAGQFFDELVIHKVPAIKTIAATGTSHADQLDHPLPLTADFFASRFSNLRLNPAGTSNMRSSPYNWTTFLVPASTDAQRLHVRKCSSMVDRKAASTSPST